MTSTVRIVFRHLQEVNKAEGSTQDVHKRNRFLPGKLIFAWIQRIWVTEVDSDTFEGTSGCYQGDAASSVLGL